MNLRIQGIARDGKVSQGELTFVEFSQADRKKRALKTFGILFGCACVSVLFPILHWILVPGFLASAPVGAYFISKIERKMRSVSLNCPSCGTPLKIANRPMPAEGFESYEEICDSCRAVVKITG